MRGLCMINVDKKTYLTQTGPRNNGQTSGITSQKRKARPTGEINSGGEHQIPGGTNHRRG